MRLLFELICGCIAGGACLFVFDGTEAQAYIAFLAGTASFRAGVDW